MKVVLLSPVPANSENTQQASTTRQVLWRQWLSSFLVYQIHLEALLVHRSLGPTSRVFESVGVRCDTVYQLY